MYKVKLTLNRLAALTATSAFCLLATSCGGDDDKKEAEASKVYKEKVEASKGKEGAEAFLKSIASKLADKQYMIVDKDGKVTFVKGAKFAGSGLTLEADGTLANFTEAEVTAVYKDFSTKSVLGITDASKTDEKKDGK